MMRYLLALSVYLSCQAVDISFFISDANGIPITKTGSEWINPASLTKTILADRAQIAAPLGLTWVTFAEAPTIKSGTISSPLHIIHQDPLLSTTDLKKFARTLKQMGVNAINAPIINHYQPIDTYANGIFQQESLECYTAHANGLFLDENCQKRTIYPRKDTSLMIDGNRYVMKYASLQNCPITTDYAPEAIISNHKRTVILDPNQHKMLVCQNDNTPFELSTRNNHTEKQISKQLAKALASQNITYQKITFKPSKHLPSAKKNAIILTQHTAESLYSQLLKQSDNYLANWLYERFKIGTLGPYLKDGAGLSRYNWVSISAITEEYRKILQNSPIRDLLPDQTHPMIQNLDLPISKDTQLIFKSGTLAHVKNLSGVIRTDGHDQYFFTISCQDPKAIDGACNQAIKDTLTPYLTAKS